MTRSFSIPYHNTLLSVDIPETNLGYYIDLDSSALGDENIESLQMALDNNGSGYLENFIRDKHVGLGYLLKYYLIWVQEYQFQEFCLRCKIV